MERGLGARARRSSSSPLWQHRFTTGGANVPRDARRLLLGQLAAPDPQFEHDACGPHFAHGLAGSGGRDHPPASPSPAGARAAPRSCSLPAAPAAASSATRTTTDGPPTATATGKPSGDLTISNWALYIDKQTIPDFEQETGINVDYVEDINSYDEFFGKMQPLLAQGESGGRRLMVANDWLAKRMYHLGYIQKLDQEALAPALKHLNPSRLAGLRSAHDTRSPGRAG